LLLEKILRNAGSRIIGQFDHIWPSKVAKLTSSVAYLEQVAAVMVATAHIAATHRSYHRCKKRFLTFLYFFYFSTFSKIKNVENLT